MAGMRRNSDFRGFWLKNSEHRLPKNDSRFRKLLNKIFKRIIYQLIVLSIFLKYIENILKSKKFV